MNKNNSNTPIRDLVIKPMLLKFPDISIFLEKQGYSLDQVNMLTEYGIFGWLTPYIYEKFNGSQKNEVVGILTFLNQYYSCNDSYINNLIGTGFLENFDTIKDILPELILLFPKEMHDDFMKHYSHYLINSNH